MTDKEQALVAAAYRVAAGAVKKEGLCENLSGAADVSYNLAIEHSIQSIGELTPSDAETKLRALMMGVAITMMNRMYGERAWVDGPLRQIVDEVLNEHPA